MIVLTGVMRNYPPEDLDSVGAFLASLPVPIFDEVFRRSRVVSELRSYHLPGSQRRWWESLPDRPENFVVLGDAVASFNPVFGQGMTTAAAGATVLWVETERARSEGTLGVLATRVQRGIAPIVDLAFSTAVGVDARYEGAEFVNLEPPTLGSQSFGQALSELQTVDADVMQAARRAALFMEPEALATEEITRNIADWQASGRRPEPAMTDPSRVPALSGG